MSEEIEVVMTDELWMKPLGENSTKDKKKKKKRPSDDDDKKKNDDEGLDESEEPKAESKSKPKVNLFEPEILEGKREKKTIERLYLVNKPKEKLKIESIGDGDKLGDIARINHSIGKLHVSLLRPLHKVLYDRPGTASTLRKNLRLFNGFSFGQESELYNKKMEKMKKLPKGALKNICQILDLERSGVQIVLLERIMRFLISPTNSGKPVLKKKKKTTKDAKREKSSSKSKKTQKKVESGKSKPIVTDSSSDEDDDDDDEEEDGKKISKSIEKSASPKDNDSDKTSDSEDYGDEEEDGDGKEDSEEEEKPPNEEKKSSTKKSPSVNPTKKSKTNKKSDQTASDDSEQDFQEKKKTKPKPATKRKAPAKPVPKTKKADSSSNRGKKAASKIKDETDSSDDDDQPLIKMIKKPPTDEQLKMTIQELLKDANLEEVTMKQITRQVYDKYPDFDLASRKELIRKTVKTLLS